ncbi:hypothetical protein [Modestobacter excelsi]|uniref:hypothetical protein n=1 Tax=Modestobacter excelsi TaxID=2213161 RepID=UPI00110D0D42|nr:hypothetical protein [Modestobacter excelsi]
MSTPRDRDGDAFDDGRADGPAGWQEPAHLGGGKDTPDSWRPAGWDLPAAEPDRPSTEQPAARQQPWQPPAADQRTSDAPDLTTGQPIMVPPADPWGTQAWAMSVGWVLSDGTAPEDAALTALASTAPVRPGREDRAGHVLRGRGNGLDLVAFDIVSPVGRQGVVTHAVTAAPVLGEVPAFRLSPARMWRHGVGGLVQVPSPDPEFDRRWVLLAAEDGPQVRRLVEDPVVRQLLLGSDDGDELWSAVGFVAAVRPDGNRPQLIEHHARLLAAVVGALAAAT